MGGQLEQARVAMAICFLRCQFRVRNVVKDDGDDDYLLHQNTNTSPSPCICFVQNFMYFLMMHIFLGAGGHCKYNVVVKIHSSFSISCSTKFFFTNEKKGTLKYSILRTYAWSVCVCVNLIYVIL